MTTTKSTSLTRALKGAAVALAFLASGTAARADGPFQNLSGTWAGSGVVVSAEGNRENIRCNGAYAVNGSATNLDIRIRCASQAYKFELTGSITHVNGAINGIWNESTYSIGGTVTGSGAPGRINVRADGMALTAQIGITTRENRQNISIRSPGSPLSEVAINLNRSK